MSHNRNRNYTPLADLNRVTTPVQTPAPTSVRNRDLDPMTNEPYKSLNQWGDAPQTIKAKAEAKTRDNENITFTEGNGDTAVIMIELKRLRPVKAKEGKSSTADLYATGSVKLKSGVTVGINVTRRYTPSDGATIKCENGSMEIVGQTHAKVRIAPKYIGPSSTGTTNLYVKINGSFEVPGRGIFNISLNGYKKPTV